MSAKNSISIVNKRRQQLTRQLVMSMMDKPPKGGGTATPGLLTKLMTKLENDLDSTDEDLRHKSMDKIIKLMPFVIAKERGPAIQLIQNNNTTNKIVAGKGTSIAIDNVNSYLEKRQLRMDQRAIDGIEEAQIIEVVDAKHTPKTGPILPEDDYEEEEE